MTCLQCGGPLEYAGQHAEHARCTHCLALFTNGQNGLTPLEVRSPTGNIDPAFTAVFAQQLGFAPRHASHQTFNVGGVGLKVNTSKLEREAKNKLSGMIWGAGIGLFVILCLIGVGIFVWLKVREAANGGGEAAAAPTKAQTWDGKAPFICSALDNVKLENVTANLTSGPAITASAGCQLTLVNVNVSAPVAIDASGNAKVTVTGGSIKGTTHAIVASGNAQVIVSGAKVDGKTQASANGKIVGAGAGK